MNWRWLTLSFLWAALIWQLTTTPQPVIFSEPWYQSILMLASHFFFFGVLSLSLYFARFTSRESLLLTALYGAIVEAFQLWIPGRSADLLDLFLDLAGALIFLWLINQVKSKLL